MRVRIGTFGRPVGVRGQVSVRLTTDDPYESLAEGTQLAQSENGPVFTEVESVRVDQRGAVVSLAGVTSREDAEELRGRELWREVSSDIGEDVYFRQLVGLTCVTPAGVRLGTVVDVQGNPAHDLLVVDVAGQELLLPYIPEFVQEVAADKIVVTPPAGWLELADN